jgi:hypothetical protein
MRQRAAVEPVIGHLKEDVNRRRLPQKTTGVQSHRDRGGSMTGLFGLLTGKKSYARVDLEEFPEYADPMTTIFNT